MDCSLPGSSVHGNSPGKNTGVGCHTLLQGIFPTQGSNWGLLHCRQILYQLSYKRSPWILEWVSIPSPGDLPHPGIKPGSSALQADSLSAELPGKLPVISYFPSKFRVGLPNGSAGKESTCKAGHTGDVDLIPRLGRFPRVGNGNQLQYSCLKNSMDRGAWWATVHGVAE